MQKKDIYNFYIKKSFMLLIISAFLVSISACGKKGPPLRPNEEKIKQ